MLSWAKILELVVSGVITLLVGMALVALNVPVRRWANRKKQAKIDELAELRGEAIAHRNIGLHEVLHGKALTDWVSEAKGLEQALIDKAREISKGDGSLLDHQDWVADMRVFVGIPEGDQRTTLRNLSGVILRAERVLTKWRL